MKKMQICKTLLLIMMMFFVTGCSQKAEKQPETIGVEVSTTKQEASDTTQIRVGSLKGPTSMGLLWMMESNEEKKSNPSYAFTMETDASALLPLMIKKELDIALVPANVAATLYQKMSGELAVIDINTENVLSILSADTSVSKIKDLKGKTIYLTGKGTTPDYVLSYLLEQNGLQEQDVTLEYKSEVAEVAAILAEHPESFGLLPQPFVTSACMQNPNLSVRISLGEAWKEINQESSIVTGVTVVRKEFLEEHPDAVKNFMEQHQNSVAYVNENIEEAAALVVKYGILGKEAVAIKAIPECNITYKDCEEMKQLLSGYLKVLYDLNPSSVGGAIPGDDFYYAASKS